MRIHVTDYPIGDVTLVYCTAEIFTWQRYEDKAVIVLYGALGETHELLLKRGPLEMFTATSPGVKTKVDGQYLYAQWSTMDIEMQTIRAGNIYIYLVGRSSLGTYRNVTATNLPDRTYAYDFWVTDLAGQSPLVIRGGYLVRSASLTDGVLSIRADFNRSTAVDLVRNVNTVTVEIMAVPKSATSLVINNTPLEHETTNDGNWLARVDFPVPTVSIPNLATLPWKHLDSLPELQPGYSDATWPNADHTTTNNTYVQPPLTPTSLFASDYGFHAGGALLYRGHFTATGTETSLTLVTRGGTAFASAVWLNDTFLGSWPGNASAASYRATYPVRLTPGQPYVLTVLVDNMGNPQNALVGADEMKTPRGIMEYGFGMSGGTRRG
jgi:hypothetical protein